MNPSNPYGSKSKQPKPSNPNSSLNRASEAEEFADDGWETVADKIADEATLKAQKMETCRKIAAIDSIRSGISCITQDSSVRLSLIPKALTYEVDNGNIDSEGLDISSPPTRKVKFHQDPSAISNAISKLHATVKQCFIVPQSIFINQTLHNEKANRIAALIHEQKMEEKADTTSELLVKHGGPNSKLAGEKHRQDLKAKAVELGKRAQSMEAQLRNERAKRIKLEQELRARENSSKEGGRKPGTAHPKTNPPATSHQPQQRQQSGKNQRRRGKGGRGHPAQQTTGEGRGRAQGASSEHDGGAPRNSSSSSNKGRKNKFNNKYIRKDS